MPFPGVFPTGLFNAAAGAANFPTVAGTNSGQSAASTSYNAPLPASISAGDLLIVFVFGSPSTPSGWTQLFSSSGFAGYYKVASGSEGASVAFSGSSTPWASTSYRITGYQGTPEAGTMASGTSATADPPSKSPSWGSDKTLWLAAMFATGTVTSTAPTNYTNQVTGGTTGARVSSAQRALQAATEDPGTFALSGSANWLANTVAIRGI